MSKCKKKRVRKTHRGQFRNHDAHCGQEIHHERPALIVGVVRAQQEQDDGGDQEEFLGRRVLVPVVDLLPHVQVVVGARVKLEGHPLHVVEHQVRAEHVRDVGQRPGGFLAERERAEENFQQRYQQDVDRPCSYVLSERISYLVSSLFSSLN